VSERPKAPSAEEPPKPPPAEDETGYTTDEEAEVQKRLEELGYVE